MMRVALLAPIDNSLYARLVLQGLLEMDGVKVAGVLVRSPWNLQRLRAELRRDGVRLLRKVARKLVLGDARFEAESGETLLALARERGLRSGSLRLMTALHAIPYMQAGDHNDARALAFLRETNANLMTFAGGGLLRAELLALPGLGVLNCHTGMLPRYRGMDVVEWTAAEGKVAQVGFGASLHFMERGVDSGPILLQECLEARAGEDFARVRERLEVVMVRLMLAGAAGLRDGELKATPQAPEAGRQYYVMHTRTGAFAERMRARQVDKS